MVKQMTVIILIILILTACGNSNATTQTKTSEAQTVFVSDQPQPYSLYYESNIQLGLYEPEIGCYLGSYVLSNKQINFEMKTFDEMTKKDHAVSMYNLKAGNAFPSTWVVNCIAEMKTPYIVLKPQNDYNPFDRKVIDSIAESFGEFYVPIFVEFFPSPASITQDDEAYVSFFRYARKAFSEKASNVAFVWSVDAADVTDCERFYPGDEWTDWVSLRIWETLGADDYGEDIFSDIDYFYYSYQKTHPIMISGLAVSHYSNGNHIYRNQLAADEIARIYSTVINDYPRIKLITYLDYNEQIATEKNKDSNSFSITDNDIVLEAYRKAIADKRFLSATSAGATGQETKQLIRSPFEVYKIGSILYASDMSFQYDLKTRGLIGKREINGQQYFDMNSYAKNSKLKLNVDADTRKVSLVSK
ncbi:MAG: glycoside hydrolase family 26 protein [Clostridiales bacterium]|jgi:hypothetical protein|nr:glycoside hydrolase family 26 protein [Clostridiales bacterium]